jgi:2-C-methyl-D-erythritol 4-phosphate cytidylyltransferase
MNIAVIFAGGVGRRMNTSGMPKQFLTVNGIPIIIHTLQVFQKCSDIDKIVVACLSSYMDTLRELVEDFRITKVDQIVPGGETGQESIHRGLLAASHIEGEDKIVLIHDGVRPLIDSALIRRNLRSVREKGSAISAVPAKETIVRVSKEGQVDSSTRRDETMLARAPQSFYLKDILHYYDRAEKEGLQFVDSCTLMLHYGQNLHIVETDSQNIKITTPDDYYIFKALLSARENAQILGVS